MRTRPSQLLLVIVALLVMSAAPSFAADTECKICQNYLEPTTHVTAAYCRDTALDEMGNLKCQVEWYATDQLVIAQCLYESDFCMSIVVEG